MFIALLLSAVALAAPDNLVVDANFAEGLGRWRVEAGDARAEVTQVDGQACASLHGDTVKGYPRIVQEFAPVAGAIYSAEVLARDTGITGGYGAYMTLEFSGTDGKRIFFEQSSPALPDGSWTRLVARCAAPDTAARGTLCLVLRGAGTGYYRAPSLTILEAAPPKDSPAELRLRFGAPSKAPFVGFGYEDDGWNATKLNVEKGVTPADLERLADRALWMKPAAVRMFFWYQEFNPGGDWSTFDFESDGMRSHYHALDTYQKLGTTVNVTGVEWSVKTPWAQPEALAHAVGELFSELVTRRGYTCIKQWTLTNEPNTHFLREGATFATYAQLHDLVAREFAARGLKIDIIGSDDTNGGLPWFTECVKNDGYFANTSLMASHFYMQRDSLRAAKYNLDDRLSLLAGRKPFVVEEFGFQDARSGAVENPLMDEFEYGLLAASFAIDAVARGTAGLNIWCWHETNYPVGYMNYGLFHYKDKDWSPKPVFYAWAMLTRNTRPGDAVRASVEPLPANLSALRIGDAVYFVNRGATPIRLTVEDLSLHEARVFDAACMPAATDEAAVRAAAEGRALTVEQGGISLPPQSFGRAW